MAYATTIRSSERYLALTAVVVLHAAALLFLVLQRWQQQPPMQELGPLKVIALSSSTPERSPPPPAAVPSKIVLESSLRPQVAISEEADAADNPTSDAGCVPLEEVRETIANDPAAVASVLNAPPDTRSIAEAIVIWNGDWIQAASTDQSPLAPTRWAVEKSVAKMSDHCLDEPVAGPRLIPFSSASGTTFLVFGSGNWKWRDVADDVLLGTSAAIETPETRRLDRALELVDRFVPGSAFDASDSGDAGSNRGRQLRTQLDL